MNTKKITNVENREFKNKLGVLTNAIFVLGTLCPMSVVLILLFQNDIEINYFNFPVVVIVFLLIPSLIFPRFAIRAIKIVIREDEVSIFYPGRYRLIESKMKNSFQDFKIINNYFFTIRTSEGNRYIFPRYLYDREVAYELKLENSKLKIN